jgi:hypothetical protein
MTFRSMKWNGSRSNPMYQPLKVPIDLAPIIKVLVRHLDMLLGDVHSMLRLPLQEEGMTHGCNFAAAVVLLELIGGVSSTLFQAPGGSWLRYRQLLERYYPWDAEGEDDHATVSEELYKLSLQSAGARTRYQREKGRHRQGRLPGTSARTNGALPYSSR